MFSNSRLTMLRLGRALFLLLVCLLFGLSPALQAAEDPLVVGIFPRRNATQTVTMFTPLVDYLSEQLRRKVQLVTAKDFTRFWQGVSEQEYDLVHFNQFHYIKAASDYEVILHNQEFGRSTVAGALYVRRDSGITEVSELRGKQLVFGGGEDAMMSYILPRFLLQQAGLSPADYRSRFASNPPNALLALYYDQADASGGGDILKQLPLVQERADTEQLDILAKTEPVLHLPWAVKRTMSVELRHQLQRLLLGLKTTEQGRRILSQAKMSGFGMAQDSDYDPHRNMVRAALGEQE